MDDLIVFDKTPKHLRAHYQAIRDFLGTELALSLHPTKVKLSQAKLGANYLGYQVYPHYKHIHRHTLVRFRQLLYFFNFLLDSEQYPNPNIPLKGFWCQYMSSYSHADSTPSYYELTKMLSSLNSYLGMLGQGRHIRLCQQLYHQDFHLLKQYFIPKKSDYSCVKLRKSMSQSFSKVTPD